MKDVSFLVSRTSTRERYDKRGIIFHSDKHLGAINMTAPTRPITCQATHCGPTSSGSRDWASDLGYRVIYYYVLYITLFGSWHSCYIPANTISWINVGFMLGHPISFQRLSKSNDCLRKDILKSIIRGMLRDAYSVALCHFCCLPCGFEHRLVYDFQRNIMFLPSHSWRHCFDVVSFYWAKYFTLFQMLHLTQVKMSTW